MKVNAFDLARTSHIDIAIAVPSSMEVDLKNQDFIMEKPERTCKQNRT